MKETAILSPLLFICLLTVLQPIQSYSPEYSYQLLHFSRIAYEDKEIIESWTCVKHCSLVEAVNPKVIEYEGNLGFISYSPLMSAIVVTFRGSDYDEPGDWITDLTYFRTNYLSCTDCKVHTGFYSASMGLRQQVRLKISQFRQVYPQAKLIMAGHSLGGALATMQAIDNQEYGNNVDQVYIFGNPRVGNKQFAQYYNQKVPLTFRVVNYGDLIVHLPPMSWGYHHVGHQIWFNPRGMINYNICSSEQWNCANSLSFWSFSYNDHRIYQYIKMPSSGQKINPPKVSSHRPIVSQARMEQIEEQKVRQAIQALISQN